MARQLRKERRFDSQPRFHLVASAVLASALLVGGALPAPAQTGGGSSSMPGTAGINPGSVSQETVDEGKTKDSSAAGTAGTAYPGSSGGGPAGNPLGTNPLSSGNPNPTGGSGAQTGGPSGGQSGRTGDDTGRNPAENRVR